MSLLSQADVRERLKALTGWSEREGAIEKRFERGDFNGSLAFVNAAAALANAQNHHPDVAISWGTVTFTLSSHDAGGLTERDFRLARAIEELAGRSAV